MALNAPNCKDTQDVQFKLQDKFVAFKKCGELRSAVKLLAVSSSRDLLFAGNPAAPELKVIIIKDVVAAKTSGKQPLARRVLLPHIPNYMSCSSDGNLLAINYTQSNGTSLLYIYAVQSFVTPDIRPLYSIRLAPEDFVLAVQLLWNPVLPNSLAVVLSNGALAMYTLKEGGNFELHSLDKSQQVKCGCWSPKGKQIVLGFPNGKLQQFKPDLTPAKTLVCPPNVHAGPFDTLAVHWLSTFQFAVIFLQHGVDCNPALYIINAPKAGAPSYTNYYDICYSLNGPRNHQFHFTHVQQWNLLLVSSANGVEVGVLGTSEAGDTPTWQQLTLLDEARIELPLSEETQDETFPLGFVYDTSSTHQLSINEQQLPSMPMVHVLGTDGTLLTFNFLNLQPGAASVCSPPPPLADTSGQYFALDTLLGAEEPPSLGAALPTLPALPAVKLEPHTPALSDISFAFTPNTVTSTPAPAKDKPASLFAGFGNAPGIKAAPPAAAAPTFGASTFPTAPLNFAAPTKPLPAAAFAGFAGGVAATATPPRFTLPVATAAPNFGQLDKPVAVAAAPVPTTVAAAPLAAPVKSKPLYTVPPTFTPAAPAPTARKSSSTAGKNSEISAREIDDVIAEIMSVQIAAFSEQIEQQKQQTKALLSQIEAPSSVKYYAKRLDDLQELNDQANDVEFELDVQGLRHALSEAYAMMAECRAKLDVYRNPDITRLMSSTSFDAAGRRLLSRLQSYLSANEAQLHLAQQHIDTQWEQFQDVLRRNSKSKMHMPCLEGIYQRLTRLQNLASDQRIKQTNIKAKLKDRGLLQSSFLNQEHSRQRNNEAVDTLADSILSMSLNQVVDTNRAKLSVQKLQSIRNLLQNHKIQIISPQRPDRVGLKSEVILETKLKAELSKKAAAANAKPATAHKATQAATAVATAAVTTTVPTVATVAAVPIQLPKTVATVATVEKTRSKPVTTVAAPTAAAPVPTPTTTAAAFSAAPFSFFQNSPFSKTTTVTPTTTAADPPKPPTSVSGGSFAFSFGQQNAEKPASTFGGISQPPTAASSSNLFAGFGSTPVDATKPKAATATEQLKEVPIKPIEPKKEGEIKATVAEPQASNIAGPKTPTAAEPAAKPFSFSGFGSNSGTIGGSTFNFGGFGSSLGNTAAPKVPAATSVTTTTAAAAVTSNQETTVTTAPPTATLSFGKAAAAAAPSETTELPTDNLFGSLNICKPQVKDKIPDAAPSNIFSGFAATPAAAVGDASKELFGGSVVASVADSNSKTTTAFGSTTTAAAFGTPTTAAFGTTTTAAFGTTAITTTPAVAATPATSVVTTTVAAPFAAAATTTTTTVAATVVTAAPSVITTAAPTVVATTAAATIAVPAAATTAPTAAPGSSFSFSNAFSSLSTANSSPTGSLTTTSSAASTTSNASTSIFGGGNAFASAATVASPFQATAAAAAPPAANLFGNVPKPEASVFGTATATVAAAPPPPTGLFAAAAANSTPSPFGGSPAAAAVGTPASGGNIFGQAAAATAAVKPSGFGSQTASPAPSGGSIFGGASSNASPFGGGSIFGGSNSAQSSPATASTGSIFGQSVFGSSATSSGGNLFTSASPAQQPATGFGGGSVFGGSAANATSPAVSGGSIFGGGNNTSVGFGSFAQTTPTAGGFGSSFAQNTGGSVAQSGFGSPQQQQTQQSPAGGFGAKPVFGGSPAFGASPTFGGAPTFGSPKGFGAFGNSPGVVAPAFGAQPKPADGNIFETLGGTDTGLSFGNLAQTGNTNQQKSSFGGSSFMTYR